MEGNECYRFSTVCRYIEETLAKPIEVALDIGCNVGEVTRLMRSYFGRATIFAFEPVREYYERACATLSLDLDIKVFNVAICGLHLFKDDVGSCPRSDPVPLRIFKGLPASGPGWLGGSFVTPVSSNPPRLDWYEELTERVVALTLDQAVAIACALSGRQEVDFVKMDCEGCEISALGCASQGTLERIRFIGGEYHGIGRFYDVMRTKLYRTHFVNLVGGREQGSFFCERKGALRTILEHTRDGVLQVRPWLSDQPIDWHLFRQEFVLPSERSSHGL